MIPDRRHGAIGILIGPHGIVGALASHRNAVIAAIALVGTIGPMDRTREQRHVHIRAWDILDSGIGRLLQGQRVPGVGDDPASDGDDNPAAGRGDGDGMVRTWRPHRHGGIPFGRASPNGAQNPFHKPMMPRLLPSRKIRLYGPPTKNRGDHEEAHNRRARAAACLVRLGRPCAAGQTRLRPRHDRARSHAPDGNAPRRFRLGLSDWSHRPAPP